MDYTNKALGLRTQTQIPLDVKTYSASEEALRDLGPGNNLAFVYQKGLIVYCISEGTRYEWKEMEFGDVGLLDNNFVYPNNIVAFGIDYSNKEYNFVSVDTEPSQPQGLQSVLNVGNTATQNYNFQPTGTYAMTGEQFTAFISLALNAGRRESGGFTYYGNRALMSGSFTEDSSTNVTNGTITIDAGKLEMQQNSGGNFNQKVIVRYQYPINNDIVLEYPTKSVDGVYVLATEDMIPVVDGSETKINNSSTITKTGTGTTLDPYVLNVVQSSSQKILTSPTDFTSNNYTLTSADINKLIIINNGATNVTITVPTGLPTEFFAAFIRKGSGEVSFIASGTTINNAISGLRINRQFDQVALDKEGTSNIFYLTGNTKV